MLDDIQPFLQTLVTACEALHAGESLPDWMNPRQVIETTTQAIILGYELDDDPGSLTLALILAVESCWEVLKDDLDLPVLHLYLMIRLLHSDVVTVGGQYEIRRAVVRAWIDLSADPSVLRRLEALRLHSRRDLTLLAGSWLEASKAVNPVTDSGPEIAAVAAKHLVDVGIGIAALLAIDWQDELWQIHYRVGISLAQVARISGDCGDWQAAIEACERAASVAPDAVARVRSAVSLANRLSERCEAECSLQVRADLERSVAILEDTLVLADPSDKSYVQFNLIDLLAALARRDELKDPHEDRILAHLEACFRDPPVPQEQMEALATRALQAIWPDATLTLAASGSHQDLRTVYRQWSQHGRPWMNFSVASTLAADYQAEGGELDQIDQNLLNQCFDTVSARVEPLPETAGVPSWLVPLARAVCMTADRSVFRPNEWPEICAHLTRLLEEGSGFGGLPELSACVVYARGCLYAGDRMVHHEAILECLGRMQMLVVANDDLAENSLVEWQSTVRGTVGRLVGALIDLDEASLAVHVLEWGGAWFTLPSCVLRAGSSVDSAQAAGRALRAHRIGRAGGDSDHESGETPDLSEQLAALPLNQFGATMLEFSRTKQMNFDAPLEPYLRAIGLHYAAMRSDRDWPLLPVLYPYCPSPLERFSLLARVNGQAYILLNTQLTPEQHEAIRDWLAGHGSIIPSDGLIERAVNFLSSLLLGSEAETLAGFADLLVCSSWDDSHLPWHLLHFSVLAFPEVHYIPAARVLRRDRVRRKPELLPLVGILGTTDVEGFRGLPGATREADLIQEFGGLALAGDDATREAVKSAIVDAELLHIGCHHDWGDGELAPRLILADGACALEDLLRVGDAGSKVSLSSCHAGARLVGRMVGSDVSMAGALVGLGCSEVVAGFWSIVDASSPVFFRALFQRWTLDGDYWNSYRHARDALRRDDDCLFDEHPEIRLLLTWDPSKDDRRRGACLWGAFAHFGAP